jgi:hypothetical protein
LTLWLAGNGTTPEARFVYKAWLDAKGGVGAVSEKLLVWVAEHGTTPEARFVYKAWLDAEGKVGAVSEKLLLWVAEHGTTPEADFLYRAWLDSGQPLDSIKQASEAWLKLNWHREEAVYLTKALSQAKELSFSSVGCIVAWAGLFPKHEDAVYRLSRVSRLFKDHRLSAAFRKLVARSNNSVIAMAISKAVITEGEKQAIRYLFANLVKFSFPREAHWHETLALFRACLAHKEILQTQDEFLVGTWVLLLHDALKEQILDLERDRAAIIHAYDLIRQSLPHQDYSNLIGHGYLPPPPSVLEYK